LAIQLKSIGWSDLAEFYFNRGRPSRYFLLRDDAWEYWAGKVLIPDGLKREIVQKAGNPSMQTENIIGEIHNLPAYKEKKEYWDSKTIKTALSVIELNDNNIWREFRKIIPSLSAIQKMKIISIMNNDFNSKKSQFERIIFLKSLFDDKSEAGKEKITGSDKVFTGPPLPVYKFAFLKAASILGLSRFVTPRSTDRKWKRYIKYFKQHIDSYILMEKKEE
jgi:hypothetical protein